MFFAAYDMPGRKHFIWVNVMKCLLKCGRLRLKKTLNLLVSKYLKWLTHPTVVFSGLQILWVAVTILWVIWFVNQKEALSSLSKTLGDKDIDPTYGIVFLTIGCILLGMILVGMVLLFTFAQKQSSLNRRQRSFLSSVTHELKSPLTSLQLSFETIQRQNLPTQVKSRLFTIVERDIGRLVRLVNSILISSRLDRGIYHHGSSECFLLKDLIDKVVEQALYLDEQLKKRLVITCDENLQVKLPKMALGLVIENLLENAVKYSKKGSAIEVKACYLKNQILLSVSDNGFGLKGNEVKKVFRMFYRAEIASKKAIAGTGLGLYIIKSTIKLMGGKVWAKSPGLGMGSTFFITLPQDNQMVS